jgi:hypothetical protein
MPTSDLCYADFRLHAYIQHFCLNFHYTIRVMSDPALRSDLQVIISNFGHPCVVKLSVIAFSHWVINSHFLFVRFTGIIITISTCAGWSCDTPPTAFHCTHLQHLPANPGHCLGLKYTSGGTKYFTNIITQKWHIHYLHIKLLNP